MQTAQTPHLCENQIGTIVLNWGHAPGKGIFGIKNTKGSNPFRIFIKSLLFVPRWKKCLTCISSYFLFVFFQTESIILLIIAESESEGYGSIPNKEGTFGKEVAREKIHQGVYNLITICLHMAWKWWNYLRCFWPAQPCGQQREQPSNEAKSYHPPVCKLFIGEKKWLQVDDVGVGSVMMKSARFGDERILRDLQSWQHGGTCRQGRQSRPLVGWRRGSPLCTGLELKETWSGKNIGNRKKFISTEGALGLPTTYDNHPSNPIPPIRPSVI